MLTPHDVNDLLEDYGQRTAHADMRAWDHAVSHLPPDTQYQELTKFRICMRDHHDDCLCFLGGDYPLKLKGPLPFDL
jgi:hypothetical protein